MKTILASWVRIAGRRRWIVVLALALCLGGMVATFWLHRAMAEGVPTVQPLSFTGMLEESGTPVDGSRDVVVRLFAASTGGSAVCTTTASGTTVSHGQFRVALDVACATAVHANPDLWIEAQVDSTTFPRAKVSAVPYALEAGSAVAAGGDLAATIADLQGRVARIEARACPEDMVLVGDFCIDKYEASVWDHADCTGTQYGRTVADDYPLSTFPDNGDYTSPLYACSVSGVPASKAITWFQAQQACVLSGKRLCTNEEWQAAAAGTPDPGSWPDTSSADGCTGPASTDSCTTCAAGAGNTGQATACVSQFGAHDMIGGVSEWVAWWGQTGVHWMTTDGSSVNWDSAGNFDDVSGINGRVLYRGSYASGFPGAAQRGGNWASGGGGGAFALEAAYSPIAQGSSFGFRCCRAR